MKRDINVLIRMLKPEDIEAIIAMDARAVGEARADYWKHTLAIYADGRNTDNQLARVAEVNGRVVGFMIGEIRSWEFRQPPTGWITALATDPQYRRHGIGRLLLAETLNFFRDKGLENVRTMVEWSDGEVLPFFTGMGFDRGPFIELEKKL